MRSVRPSTVSISTSAGQSAGKRASKSGRTSATTLAATARTAGDDSVGSAYSSSVALRSTMPSPIAYGSENCASTSLVGRELALDRLDDDRDGLADDADAHARDVVGPEVVLARERDREVDRPLVVAAARVAA